jgi:hypothetical protein
LLDQRDFIAASVHTSYLDDVLSARQGRPFTSLNEQIVDIAAMAAAIYHTRQLPTSLSEVRRPADPQAANQPRGGWVLSDPPAGWKARGRLEGLRS